MKSQTTSKSRLVGLKARSLDQILEKHCAHSRGRIFRPLIVKLGQNVCLDEISDKFENVGSKTRSVIQNLEKHYVSCRGYIFSPIIIKLCQNFCLYNLGQVCKFVMSGKNYVTRLIHRKNLCTFWRPHFQAIISPIIIKLCQNF